MLENFAFAIAALFTLDGAFLLLDAISPPDAASLCQLLTALPPVRLELRGH